MTKLQLKSESGRRDILLILALLVASVALTSLPNPFRSKDHEHSMRVRAEVVAVDNTGVQQFGIVKQGDQVLTVEILRGRFRGRELPAVNVLIGKLELDKLFREGDRALVVLDLDPTSGEILFATVSDHYRINIEIILAALFAAALIGFGGWVGVKAALSFVFSGIVIWKVMLPGFLLGFDPILTALCVVVLLTAAVQFLIGGMNRTGVVAFAGAMAGVLVTACLALVFGRLFRVHGAVRPFSETLLYSGYPHLDLSRILFAGVFVASSGAVMDVAMDVAAAMREVRHNHPEISRGRLVRSGFAVGRAIIGTMTTTLLLAYSGGYTTLLMVFLAQGVPAANVFNLSYVSAEILHTLVGSFGLVLVAPFTAVFGGWLLVPERPRAIDRAVDSGPAPVSQISPIHEDQG